MDIQGAKQSSHNLHTPGGSTSRDARYSTSQFVPHLSTISQACGGRECIATFLAGRKSHEIRVPALQGTTTCAVNITAKPCYIMGIDSSCNCLPTRWRLYPFCITSTAYDHVTIPLCPPHLMLHGYRPFSNLTSGLLILFGSKTVENPMMTKMDIICSLVEFVADEFLFFATVSKGWRHAWADRPTLTRAVTAHTSEPQLLQLKSLRDTWNPSADIAKLGNLKLLQFAAKVGYECQGWRTFYAAAQGGHKHVLVWLRKNSYEWAEDTCTGAAEGGYIDLLEWLPEHGCYWNSCTCMGAARGGHLLVVEWLINNGCRWKVRTCEGAAQGGHLHIVQWARAKGAVLNSNTINAAARRGHLHIIEWARANRCAWNVNACAEAALGGQLHILQWLRENRCPWAESTCNGAINGGHLHILQWARANGCRWNEYTCAEAARKRTSHFCGGYMRVGAHGISQHVVRLLYGDASATLSTPGSTAANGTSVLVARLPQGGTSTYFDGHA